jgi:hypothetical protein
VGRGAALAGRIVVVEIGIEADLLPLEPLVVSPG